MVSLPQKKTTVGNVILATNAENHFLLKEFWRGTLPRYIKSKTIQKESFATFAVKGLRGGVTLTGIWNFITELKKKNHLEMKENIATFAQSILQLKNT